MNIKCKILLQLLMLLFVVVCNGQTITEQLENKSTKDILSKNNAPNSITRSIIQDQSGNIWFATFTGIIKYDGTTFTSVTQDITESRFFSVLEDSKGGLWFGSIGSGVYHYDGNSFKNFTTEQGLVNNEIVSIYEDTFGDMWFGANGGMSRYDGNTFQNYILTNNTIIKDNSGITVPNLQRPINEVNSIIQDKTGKYWIATRGHTYIYDGQKFTTVTHKDQSFTNVRILFIDKKDNVWLGGNGGLWRYDGKAFTNISMNFTGYINEDKNGNIWTSSHSANKWALSRYDYKSNNEIGVLYEIKSGEGMSFGALEDSGGFIWLGTLNGVFRYDNNTPEFNWN